MAASFTLPHVIIILHFFIFTAGLVDVPLPEMKLSTPELIKYWGYPVETHKALTEDGYVLTLFRIPHGKTYAAPGRTKPDNGRPVFYLQHALLSSSADWVINLPHQSLGFVLADHGFDVWLGNVRGNRYSKQHTSLNVKDKRFWDFTIDEHARFDFPAMVDYILNATKEKDLHYVGHSQGTGMSFAGLSENPSMQSKIKLNFALGPVSRLDNLIKTAKGIASWRYRFEYIWDMLGVHEIFPERPTGWMCWLFPNTCMAMMSIMNGPHKKNLNSTRLPVYSAHLPAGTSTKNLLHWFQMAHSKSFTKYDYGAEKNLERYNSTRPPVYDISRVHTPTVLVCGTEDVLTTPEDMKWAMTKLPNVVGFIEIETYSHVDYVWGMNAGDVLHKKIIDIARTCYRRNNLTMYNG